MTTSTKLRSLATGIALTALAGAASAATVTFDLTYSGSAQGTSATASISLDDVIFEGAASGNFPGSGITAFSITVENGLGSSTFGLSDFDAFIFFSSGPLDGTIDLVGQANFQDFNFFGPELSGVEPFVFSEGGFRPRFAALSIGNPERPEGPEGDLYTLTSFAPATVAAVPLPAGGVLLITGLLGLAAARRKKKSA